MTAAQTDELTSRKPPRLWPGVIAAARLVLIRLVVPAVAPDATGVENSQSAQPPAASGAKKKGRA